MINDGLGRYSQLKLTAASAAKPAKQAGQGADLDSRKGATA